MEAACSDAAASRMVPRVSPRFAAPPRVNGNREEGGRAQNDEPKAVRARNTRRSTQRTVRLSSLRDDLAVVVMRQCIVALQDPALKLDTIRSGYAAAVEVKSVPSHLVGQDAAVREGRYQDDLWKQYTGRTLLELGEEWKAAPAKLPPRIPTACYSRNTRQSMPSSEFVDAEFVPWYVISVCAGRGQASLVRVRPPWAAEAWGRKDRELPFQAPRPTENETIRSPRLSKGAGLGDTYRLSRRALQAPIDRGSQSAPPNQP